MAVILVLNKTRYRHPSHHLLEFYRISGFCPRHVVKWDARRRSPAPKMINAKPSMT
ncbi:hypothetical protein ABG768_023680 [Culter alburnus]|uniref:Uncharacterized protein n=1 Tax=Culter alburnus TaxID=194366 RepID=A0AAW2AJV3_CULAL